jgi:hypothetical protein
MNKLEERYRIAPQMREYDKISDIWQPYVMFFQQANYSSPVVNTDSRGFRFSSKNGLVIKDFINPKNLPVGILIGGSGAFGVGATNDDSTIPSLLNEQTDLLWFNFGGRAFTSTQELLLFLLNHHHLKHIKKVLIFSGINNLAINYLAKKTNLEYGPFFSWSLFNHQMNYGTIAKKKKILLLLAKLFFPNRIGNGINYKYLTKKDFLAKLLREIRHGPENMTSDDREIDPNNQRAIINILERDLKNWRLLSDSLGFELYYILQPFVNWMARTNSQEEQKLFRILDDYRPAWIVLKDKIGPDLYSWFKESLGIICAKLKIKFIDMNSLLLNSSLDGQWIFVDRIHLNNLGYETVVKLVKEEIL